MLRSSRKWILWGYALTGVVLLAGCTRDGQFQPVSMWNESRLKPYEPNPLPGVAGVSMQPPAGTIAVGELASDDPKVTGRSGGRLLTESPIPITPAVLKRGQERYNIYCTPCHSRLGDGQGMVVRRGFPHPPDYGLQRLREAPIGHFYDVITNGYGVMYSYAPSIAVEDRWAIAAYIRVLQETRPVVTVDQWEAERQRQRQQGIPERQQPAAGQGEATPAAASPGSH